jgi:hypothetical protein
MNRLHDTQRDFSRFVFQETAQIPFGIKANGLSAEQRLAIYRNNTQLGLTEVLREIYPVLNRLVGDDFFNRLAAAYIKCFPPQSAGLFSYGGQFAELIADFDAAQGLPYLPDTARLEWYWHEAYHEADAKPFDMSTLAQLDAEQYGRLGFNVHPSVRLIASDYPIDKIWEANQPDYLLETVINLNDGGCRLLIFRPGFDVEIVSLAEADFKMLTGLASGLTLSKTIEHVLVDHPDFDMQPCLQQGMMNGLLTGFFIL